jgi:hypothetical protein
MSLCCRLFDFRGLPIGDMNFVCWLSAFAQPNRSAVTLLDQVHHFLGNMFRSANKTMRYWLDQCNYFIYQKSLLKDAAYCRNRDMGAVDLAAWSSGIAEDLSVPVIPISNLRPDTEHPNFIPFLSLSSLNPGCCIKMVEHCWTVSIVWGIFERDDIPKTMLDSVHCLRYIWETRHFEDNVG